MSHQNFVKKAISNYCSRLRSEAKKVLENKKRFYTLLFGLCIVALVGGLIPSRIVLSFGDSLNYKVLWKVDIEPSKGYYVSVKTSESDPFAEGRIITKEVVCVPGQKLTIVGDEYYCEDHYIGKALPTAKDGRPLTKFNPCGKHFCEIVVPEGHYFVAGHNPRSYDSRYIGFIPKERILCVSVPLF